MPPPRITSFPLHKPFERQEPMTPFSEIALRLVVNYYSASPYVIGTATILCGNLLVTAKHVIAEFLAGATTHSEKSLQAIQLFSGPEYIIWDVFNGVADPASDLALLRLATNPARSHHDRPIVRRQPHVNPFAPAVDEPIAAFGYRRSRINVSKNAQGGNHIDLDDEPMVSVGRVRAIFPLRRDANLPFPCFQVGARFDGGMSGGPVFDETGSLCGIVCSNIAGSHLDGEPVSFVSTLWPLFRLIVNADRGDAYPRGVSYPVIDLARGRQIYVTDLPALERWFSKHVTGSPMTSGETS